MVQSDIAKRLHEAHRKGDAAEVERLQILYEEEVRQRLAGLTTEFDALKLQQQSADASGKVRTGDTKRYKEFIALYRAADRLRTEISQYKKILREKED